MSSHDPLSAYQYTHAESQSPRPDATLAKILGGVNIAFALLVGCCGLYTAASYVVMPMFGEMMQGFADQARHEQEAQRTQRREELETQLDEAATADEREQLQAEIDVLDQLPQIPEINLGNMMGMGNRTVATVAIVDSLVGFALAVLWGVSGVGLLRLKEWARRLSWWTALGKLLQIAVGQSIWILICIPLMLADMQAFFETIDKLEQAEGGPGNPMGPMFEMQAIGARAGAIFGAVLAIIYPIVSLILLPMKRVRDAMR
jgi:hypothetical protein